MAPDPAEAGPASCADDVSPRHRQRLLVYLDAKYRRNPGTGALSSGTPFVTFACEVGQSFSAATLIGRTDQGSEDLPFRLPPRTRLAPLPHYDDLRDLRGVATAALGTTLAMWRWVRRVDVVWALGPHPFSLMLATMGILRRRRVVLGVRQETLTYFRTRLPSARWRPAMAALWVLDAAWRGVSRAVPTVVFGSHLVPAGPRCAPVFNLTLGLTRERDVLPAPPERDYSDGIRLLSVGRIEPEKNPELLVEAMAELEQREPGRYRLDWVGGGGMEDEVRRHAESRGIASRIRFRGYVAFGPELVAMYREAHAFVHVSLTEGVPLVLFEALSAGTPVVATDVGGVGEALDGGRLGVLVPPDDRTALVEGLQRVVEDADLRRRLAVDGLARAREVAFEPQARAVAGFLSG